METAMQRDDEYRLRKRSEPCVGLKFACGDEVRNEFLIKDTQLFGQQLFADSSLIKQRDHVAGFFSLHNGKEPVTDALSNIPWRRQFRNIYPEGKQFKSYPAVKLSRLATALELAITRIAY